MERITIRLPEQQIKMIDLMVDAGEFPSKSEAIRAAVRNLVDDRSDKLLDIIEKISA
ncbi:MAG: ribbon-helix-helix domain-containing protein [Methanocellales archaeon]|nr:ribbon-helix-helix domain-containing protein [Methanocellales archaeon]